MLWAPYMLAAWDSSQLCWFVLSSAEKLEFRSDWRLWLSKGSCIALTVASDKFPGSSMSSGALWASVDVVEVTELVLARRARNCLVPPPPAVVSSRLLLRPPCFVSIGVFCLSRIHFLGRVSVLLNVFVFVFLVRF